MPPITAMWMGSVVGGEVLVVVFGFALMMGGEMGDGRGGFGFGLGLAWVGGGEVGHFEVRVRFWIVDGFGRRKGFKR